jgi:hypothetical protein
MVRAWGWAAAAWAGVFAVRGAYWGSGGTVGLRTLAQPLQDAVDEGNPWIYVVLWITVLLEVFGVLLGLALVRGRGPVVRGRDTTDWLPLPAWGAAAALAGHGLVFIAWGLTAAPSAKMPTDTLDWYAAFWGPWFLLGGLLFGAAALVHQRRRAGSRTARLAGLAGAGGGLLVAVAAALG